MATAMKKLDTRILIPILLAGAVLAGLLAYLLLSSGGPAPLPRPGEPPVSPMIPIRDRTDTPVPLPADPAALRQSPRTVDERPAEPWVYRPELPRVLLSGRVLSSRGGVVEGARVRVLGLGDFRELRGEALTDNSGNYRLLAWSTRPSGTAAEGTLRVVAEVAGGEALSEVVEPKGRKDIYVSDIVAPSYGYIEGTVAGSDGAPIPGAEITAESGDPMEIIETRGRAPYVRHARLQRGTFADVSGRFRIAGLPAGQYRLKVNAGAQGKSDNAGVVVVPGGLGAWMAVSVQTERPIRGVVQDPTGEPVPGVMVRLSLTSSRAAAIAAFERPSRDNGPMPLRVNVGAWQTVTDAEGRFGFFELADGKYKVETRAGVEPAEATDLEPGGPPVTLTVGPRSMIVGSVRDAETGRPVEMFDVRLALGSRVEELRERMRLQGEGLISLVDPFSRARRDGEYGWQPRGEFRLPVNVDRAFELQITAPGYAALNVPMEPPGEGQVRRGVELNLHPLCELTLIPTREDKRVVLEPVILLRDGRDAFAGATDNAGEARLRDVAPGVYTLRLYTAEGEIYEAVVEVPSRRQARLEVALTPAGQVR
jgi:hypothetical protein